MKMIDDKNGDINYDKAVKLFALPVILMRKIINVAMRREICCNNMIMIVIIVDKDKE